MYVPSVATTPWRAWRVWSVLIDNDFVLQPSVSGWPSTFVECNELCSAGCTKLRIESLHLFFLTFYASGKSAQSMNVLECNFLFNWQKASTIGLLWACYIQHQQAHHKTTKFCQVLIKMWSARVQKSKRRATQTSTSPKPNSMSSSSPRCPAAGRGCEERASSSSFFLRKTVG